VKREEIRKGKGEIRILKTLLKKTKIDDPRTSNKKTLYLALWLGKRKKEKKSERGNNRSFFRGFFHLTRAERKPCAPGGRGKEESVGHYPAKIVKGGKALKPSTSRTASAENLVRKLTADKHRVEIVVKA